MNSRYERIFEHANADVDVIIIRNGMKSDTNFFYLTGYTNGLFELSTSFLFRDGHIEVVTSKLEEQAARGGKHTVHVQTGSGAMGLRKSMEDSMKNVKRAGVNYKGITVADLEFLKEAFKGVIFTDVSDALDKARRVKDPDEIAAISRACKIISEVVEGVPQMLHQGMTENELRADIEYDMMKKGASAPSFSSIVAFGENSAIPHYSPGARRLKAGDTVLVDIGAKYDLYCSDITRTFFYKEVSREQTQMYHVVEEAQLAGLHSIREGATGRSAYEAALKVIDATRFKGRFIHSLGHFLGIDVHDGYGRALSHDGVEPLESNMVVTVEPGVYVPGRGGVRIEDDVQVSKTGYKMLTQAPRELIVVR
ncbi:MAG: aminopeptidase P family protein [Nitrososphaerota archaeon]|jgi:Xaa-Pro dipeptidase|nr:aminopeptidase P family protein [Nitrososphaerota archaeon]